MRIKALDHVNIVTPDVGRSARFYADMLGLDPRNPPGATNRDLSCWMYDGEDRPLLHIAHTDRMREFDPSFDNTPGAPTGSVHHVALNCSGREAMISRLDAAGMEYRLTDFPAGGLKQIFVRDPDHILLELNFYED